jgi:serine/threonine-protein kinase
MADQLLHKRALSGRFEVERMLGRGGMATVYLARDTELERPVALKVLAESLGDDPAFRARFLREARLAAKLVHPHVVQVYDVGEETLGLSIVMEYVDGGTLADELRRRGRLPVEEAVDVAIQVCSALQAAHAERLVHRDVKPQNILRRSDGVVKLADFGIARSLAATRHTEIGTVLGTMAYLSPEQARGEQVTAAADLYSLGVVLYELLTGEIPFPATSLAELVTKRELGEFAPPGELSPMPQALNDTVVACLAPRPEDRPSSAAGVARRLAEAIDEPLTVPLDDETIPEATAILAAPELDRSEYANRRARMLASVRRRPLAVLAVVLLAAAGVLAAVALSGSRGKPKAAAPPTRARAATATTHSATTTSRTTATTRTTSSKRVAATPAEAIADARSAIFRAESAGLLDPDAGGDLDRRLDDIAQSLSTGNTQDASQKASDLLRRLGDLEKNGELTGTAPTRIERPLERLAALLPSTAPAPPTPSPPGHARQHGPGGTKPPKGPKGPKHP